MSMSTRVVGIREEDEEYKKMVAVAMACHQAKVDMPKEVEKYFYDTGFSTDNPTAALKVEIPFEHRNTSCSQIWEVEVTSIPKGVRRIQFENAY